MIELENVSFTYRGETDAVPALTNVDLNIEPGQFVAIIGQNGSGKSTLVKLLTAVLYPTEGNIRIDGVPVNKEHRWDVRRKVSVVLQDPDDQLIMNRVIDDVAFGPENLGLARGDRREGEIIRAYAGPRGDRQSPDRGPLTGAEAEGRHSRRPGDASSVLILDEPTSLLPVPVAMRLISTVRDLSLRENMGVVHVNSMYEAVLFERVVVMDAGRVVLDGPRRGLPQRREAAGGRSRRTPCREPRPPAARSRHPGGRRYPNTSDLRAALSAAVDPSPSS